MTDLGETSTAQALIKRARRALRDGLDVDTAIDVMVLAGVQSGLTLEQHARLGALVAFAAAQMLEGHVPADDPWE